METHTISAVASEAGVSPDTLRYYERLGLLTPPERTATGYRQYSPSAAQRVRFIKGAQRMGLRLREVKELLDIRDRGACPCGHTRGLLEQRLGQVDEEIRQLQGLRRELQGMLAGFDECPEQTAGAWWCDAEFTSRGGDPPWRMNPRNPAPSAVAPAENAPAPAAADDLGLGCHPRRS